MCGLKLHASRIFLVEQGTLTSVSVGSAYKILRILV